MSLIGTDGSMAMVQQPPAPLHDRRLMRRPDVGTVTESAQKTGDDSLSSTDDQSLAGGGITSNTVRDVPLVARKAGMCQLGLASHDQTSGRREGSEHVDAGSQVGAEQLGDPKPLQDRDQGSSLVPA